MTRRAVALVTSLAVAIIIVLVEWLVPAVIRSAYSGEALGFLDHLITGQARHPVDHFLSAWRAVARPLGATAVVTVLIAATMRILHHAPRVRRLIDGREQLSGLEVVVISAWCGALAGILEIGFIAGRHALTHRIAERFYPEILWMGPASATLAFALFGIAAAVAAVMGRVRWSPRWLCFPLFLATTWSLLQADGIGLYRSAGFVLAVGVAAASTRGVAERSAGFLRLVKTTAPIVAAALVLATGVGVILLDRERTVELPAAPDAGPNVLLIILDTVRAANTSLLGYERPTTPEIAAWASDGVTFEHAVSTAPWTLPSHATMFTGLYPPALGTSPTQPLGPDPATLAEVFDRAGYRTGGFVANDVYGTRASGLQRGFGTYVEMDMGFARFASSSWASRCISWIVRGLTGFPDAPGRKSAESVRRQFLSWLDRDSDRPFFAFLNFFDAHSPYGSPPEFTSRFGPASRGPIEPRPYEPEELVGRLNAYDGAIAYIDDQIGRLHGALDRRGLLKNTVVVITADHGEHWGEHGLTEHSGSLYIQTLHVPLVITFPARLPGDIRVREEVSLRDLAATVLDLAGVEETDAVPGVSLARLAADSAAARSPSFSELERWSWTEEWRPAARGDMRSLVEWPFQYMRFGDGEEVLYDADRDPPEETDLFDGMPARGARMRSAVDSLLWITRER